jgi:hypothetical protein
MLMPDLKDLRSRRFASILLRTALTRPGPWALTFAEAPTAKTDNRIATTTPRGKNLFIKAPSNHSPEALETRAINVGQLFHVNLVSDDLSLIINASLYVHYTSIISARQRPNPGFDLALPYRGIALGSYRKIDPDK